MSITLRFLQHDQSQNTWPDCIAESLGLALDSLRRFQAEEYPCGCEARDRPGVDHHEECDAYHRDHDIEVLLAQLHELHGLARRPRAQADPAVWVEGPDSEAARAGRTSPRADMTREEMAQRRDSAACAVEANIWAQRIALHDAETQPARARAPDPDHVPAVRQVVAWVGDADEPPREDIGDAYLDAAELLLSRAWERGGKREYYFYRHWPEARVQRLAAALRHGDEKAGRG